MLMDKEPIIPIYIYYETNIIILKLITIKN